MKNFASLPKRLVLAALLGTTGLLATSCLSTPENNNVAPDYTAADEAVIQKYIGDNKIINAQRQPSGLYFVSDSVDATAVRATFGKVVSVLYTGKFADGTVFDATSLRGNTPFTFTLGAGAVIPGWDLGIALMRKGEKARLLIPSAMAYGPSGRGPIPPNTVIFFDVKLVDVK